MESKPIVEIIFAGRRYVSSNKTLFLYGAQGSGKTSAVKTLHINRQHAIYVDIGDSKIENHITCSGTLTDVLLDVDTGRILVAAFNLKYSI